MLIQKQPMYQRADLSEWFPHFPNPYPTNSRLDEGNTIGYLEQDSVKVTIGDIDNDGENELLVSYRGTLHMFDDPGDFRHPGQQKVSEC